MKDLLKKTKINSLEDCFDLYCQTTGALVILDGLDEVANDDYDRARIAIVGLAEVLSALGQKKSFC